MPHTRGATFFLYRLSELALQCPFDSENGRGKTGLKCTQACSVIVSFSTLHFSVLYFILCEFSVLFQFSLVLRPAGSITAFQHHVTRSLRRFHVGSLAFILLSVQCSLVLRPCIFLGALQFSVLIQCSLVLRPAGSFTVFQHHVTRSLRRFHVGSPGSSPCWLDHCVSTPCGSITAADHCGGSTLNPLDLRPAGSITAFQHHVTRTLRRFHVGFNTM